MRRSVPLVSGAFALIAVLAVALASPAAASAADHYVALGDSYSSGVGAGDYTDDSGDCDRSTNAYSQLYADTVGPASYVSVACSGATTASVNATQIQALSVSTTLVSITVGGNDVGFADIMTTCVLYGEDDCIAAVDDAEATARANLAGWLDSTYSAISAAAPAARVVVLGYPVFYDLSQTGCVGLSAASRAKIDEGIALADSIIADTAAAHGFAYGDPTSAFRGHQICDDDPWLHSLNFVDVGVSYHPFADGQSGGYYPVFSALAG
ncbi:SGNH/GDSL hydrolase family protein [Jatrophihabitans sp. YIM 134969]